jgi:hypothetical protein
MMEDQWGSIADRTLEHLTSSDFAIIAVRRKLLKVARDMAEGTEPQEPFRPAAYSYHRTRFSTTEGTLDEAVEKARSMSKEKNVAGSVTV